MQIFIVLQYLQRIYLIMYSNNSNNWGYVYKFIIPWCFLFCQLEVEC